MDTDAGILGGACVEVPGVGVASRAVCVVSGDAISCGVLVSLLAGLAKGAAIFPGAPWGGEPVAVGCASCACGSVHSGPL